MTTRANPAAVPVHDPIALSRRLYRRGNRLLGPIAFSATLEDPRTVLQALRVEPGQHVLCLASAGDIGIALLATNPRRVTAVDLSLPQLHLTELKRTAVAFLPHDGYLALLGASPGSRGRGGSPATAAYQALRPELPDAVRQFWDGRLDMIDAGLLWQGAVSRLATLAGPLWLPFAGAAPQRTALLLRRVADGAHRPLCCPAPVDYPGLATRADRLVLRHGDVRQRLRAEPAGGIDRFALSNVADWLTPAGWHALLAEVVRTAAPGARVLACSRRRRLEVPSGLRERLRPDRRLERTLLGADRIRYFRSLTVLTVQGRDSGGTDATPSARGART
ncbi:DUF3419 family protein [Streptomyces sp. NPDC059688]|uniref:DUF3419 family protein n=1 Tax=Streptomyces sp. NPDC059688 TaxID=3346906 RepID=UPI00368C79FC